MRDELSDEVLAQYAKEHADDPGHGPLTRTDTLLIDVYDQLKWIEYGLYASQGGNPAKPKPTPRPGVVDETKKKATVAALTPEGVAFLADLRARRGE
jgi:hypothetical protein